MQISAISPYTVSRSASPGDDTTAVLPKKSLGQADFLKILAVQFQKQDPMKPMDDTSFIAQMAQFTALDQTSAMSRDLAALRLDQQRTVANSYLGHRVTVDVGDGTTAMGEVSAIDATGAEPQLVIDGVNYPLSAVLRVEPARVTSPSSPPASPAAA